MLTIERAHGVTDACACRIFSITVEMRAVSSGDLNSFTIFVATRGYIARRYWIIVSSVRLMKTVFTCLAGIDV
jgi:hypothetical protein